MTAPFSPTFQPDLKSLRAAILWGGPIGPATFRKLMLHFHSEQSILAASPTQLKNSGAGLNYEQITSLAKAASCPDIYAQAINVLQRDATRVISSTEADYPQRFSMLRNPPPLLCMNGGFRHDDHIAVSIVGTREATKADLSTATSIATKFASAGFTVISGLARGVDAAAHKAALKAGGRTIAIIGSGINNIYPPEHAALAAKISQAGAVISELSPNAPPARGTLIARNRLIAALSMATIAIATRDRGGTMATVRATREQNHILATVKWDDNLASHQGNRALIDEGAFPIASANDIDHLQRIMTQSFENSGGQSTSSIDQCTLFD